MNDEKVQSHPGHAAISPGVLELSPQVASDLLGHLNEARAVLRALILAEAAVAGGSINWGPGNDGPERWSPVLGVVRGRLHSVRQIVCNTVSFTSVDWPAFIALTEAIDAALWHACNCGGDMLDADELVSALRALVALLDEALDVCVSEGVPARASLH